MLWGGSLVRVPVGGHNRIPHNRFEDRAVELAGPPREIRRRADLQSCGPAPRLGVGLVEHAARVFLQGSRVLVYPLVTLDRRSKLAVMGRKRGLLEYQYCMGAETRLEGFCMRQYVWYVLGAPKLYTGTYYAYCTDCLRDCFPHCYFQYDQMPMLSCTVNYE